ncbi:hypothetical protein C0989_006758 [Termitomyces sp. Mn162]|nr:hypothetical protein C0989_006758 [Termitomyces sp. Mn162]
MSPATRYPHSNRHYQTAPYHAAAVLEMPDLLGLEVHYLSIAEQEELLLQLLAVKDTAGALLPDEPTLELTPDEISTCASPLELEEDF